MIPTGLRGRSPPAWTPWESPSFLESPYGVVTSCSSSWQRRGGFEERIGSTAQPPSAISPLLDQGRVTEQSSQDSVLVVTPRFSLRKRECGMSRLLRSARSSEGRFFARTGRARSIEVYPFSRLGSPHQPVNHESLGLALLRHKVLKQPYASEGGTHGRFIYFIYQANSHCTDQNLVGHHHGFSL